MEESTWGRSGDGRSAFFVFFSIQQRSEMPAAIGEMPYSRSDLQGAAGDGCSLSFFFLFSLTDRICDRKSQRQPQLFPI
jgi:hypothetical protein